MATLQIPKITYKDKKDFQTQGQDDEYKICAKDMNEIKETFNQSAEAIENAINELDETVQETTQSMKNAQTSEANAKSYMEEAKKNKDAILNSLGLVIEDGFLCMEEESE